MNRQAVRTRRAPDWTRRFHLFRRFDGQPVDVPPRVTTPEPRYPVASIDAWRTCPAVVREKRRSFVAGVVTAMVGYGIASAVLVLAFAALGKVHL